MRSTSTFKPLAPSHVFEDMGITLTTLHLTQIHLLCWCSVIFQLNLQVRGTSPTIHSLSAMMFWDYTLSSTLVQHYTLHSLYPFLWDFRADSACQCSCRFTVLRSSIVLCSSDSCEDLQWGRLFGEAYANSCQNRSGKFCWPKARSKL